MPFAIQIDFLYYLEFNLNCFWSYSNSGCSYFDLNCSKMDFEHFNQESALTGFVFGPCFDSDLWGSCFSQFNFTFDFRHTDWSFQNYFTINFEFDFVIVGFAIGSAAADIDFVEEPANFELMLFTFDFVQVAQFEVVMWYLGWHWHSSTFWYLR